MESLGKELVGYQTLRASFDEDAIVMLIERMLCALNCTCKKQKGGKSVSFNRP